MANLKEVEQALNTYIRPLTFPLAIKMLKSEAEIPEKTRRPFQQLKKKVAICQGIGMARKLGWAKRGRRTTLQIDLPGASKEEIDVVKAGGDLHVHVRDAQRHIALPASLEGRDIESVELRDGVLCLIFEV
jgi:HSP20 family molecular chaperone IbpA